MKADLEFTTCPASTGASPSTSATTSWRRCPASRATTRVKIIGPDIDKLEEIADKVAAALGTVNGVEEVGVFHIKGQPNLEFTVDKEEVRTVERQRQRRGGRPCAWRWAARRSPP